MMGTTSKSQRQRQSCWLQYWLRQFGPSRRMRKGKRRIWHLMSNSYPRSDSSYPIGSCDTVRHVLYDASRFQSFLACTYQMLVPNLRLTAAVDKIPRLAERVTAIGLEICKSILEMDQWGDTKKFIKRYHLPPGSKLEHLGCETISHNPAGWLWV